MSEPLPSHSPNSSASNAASGSSSLGVNPTSRRGLARRLTVQAVYQWILNQTAPETLIKEFREMPDGLGRADPEYFGELLRGTVADAATLTTQIVPHLDRPLNQLDPVEYAVLLMAVYELNNRPEVPYRVVVNEAVNLAKVFGAEDGYKFVNGVLDKIARQVRAIEIGG
ncbi:transcription antitermination factor NusB [uncultured Nevskia sp.]|uniref:transcription antitermination factor NusB n=1 Tax=uncultured Nevskia sp. TaxID=228950 RepID=UPI0025D51ADA|nr:transcription antitermination factor NusB [uncultured Nevskia sp.]